MICLALTLAEDVRNKEPPLFREPSPDRGSHDNDGDRDQDGISAVMLRLEHCVSTDIKRSGVKASVWVEKERLKVPTVPSEGTMRSSAVLVVYLLVLRAQVSDDGAWHM